MKISGFTFLRNAAILGYPFIESIKSILPIVDEYIVALGECDDDTHEQLLELAEPRIRIIQSSWCEHMQSAGYVYAQQKMMAQFNCRGDWAFYLEADEVVHEDDLQSIKSACEKYLDDLKVEALVFDYLHFYGNKNTYIDSPGWYRRAPRIIRTSVRSCAPDGLFWLIMDKSNKKARYPRSALTRVKIHHYGWVRSQKQMNDKSQRVNRYWSKPPAPIDYSQVDNHVLREYNGNHPAVMNDWLPEAQGVYQAASEYRLSAKDKRYRVMMAMERLLGIDLSRKHFTLVR